MLTALIIKDFAIIDQLELTLGDGMTVLTGETGAGKSIVINALHLLLGGRASTDVIRAGAEEAVVEGGFVLDGERAAAMAARLDALSVPFEGELVVRRTVAHSGRNKTLINGSLVTLATLRGVMRGLIDISGQHEHYTLLDPPRQLALLDRFGGLVASRESMTEQVTRLHALASELETLRGHARERLARIDYLRFQLRELEDARLDPDEEEALLAERRRLVHAEGLSELTYGAVDTLYERDNAVCGALASVASELRRGGRNAPELVTLSDQLDQARGLVDDVVHELRHFSSLDADPARLEQVESRLALLDRLKRKFGCTVEELVGEAEAARRELDALEGAENRIEAVQQEHDRLAGQLLEQARTLSQERRRAARTLEKKVEKELARLGMADSAFQVQVETHDALEGLRATGIDRVEFLLAPNKGEETRPLARIASGGELSRVMLAIKQVLASTDDVATYVFDEVDAGIGGKVAAHVAKALRDVSAEHQVLCITHLPIIASHAQHHLAVSKHLEGERTVSELILLDEQARIEEIARMLGGLTITERSLEHAAEMVQRARGALD